MFEDTRDIELPAGLFSFPSPLFSALKSGMNSLKYFAMKLDIMGRGGRKKDFWDIHTLHENRNIQSMIALYLEKYPYGFSEEKIVTDF